MSNRSWRRTEGQPTTRRRLLKQSGYVAGTATLVGLGGCIGPAGAPIGTQPAQSSGAFHQWVPEPGTTADRDHYQFYRLEPEPIDEYNDELTDDAFAAFESFAAPLTFLDVDFDEMTELIVAPASWVVRGDYEVEDVIEELEDEDFDDDDELEGYELFVDDRTEKFAAGVSSDSIVVGQRTTEEDALDVVEALIETSVGEDDSYYAEEDAMATAVDALDPGVFFTARTHEERDETVAIRGEFEHAKAWGLALDLTDGEAMTRWAVVFEDADDIDTEEIETWIETAFESFEDPEQSEAERTVVVEAGRDIDEVEAYSSLQTGEIPWRMFQYDPSNVGVNPAAATPSAPVEQRWRFATDGRVISSPAVDEESVYVGSEDQTVYSLTRSTGTEQWRVPTGGRVLSSPAVVDGTVYVGSGAGVYALSAADGTERWNFSTEDEVISSPAVVSGTVYLGDATGYVYALSAERGTRQWRFETDRSVISSPAVTRGTVYVGSGDSVVYAIDAADGTERWRFRTDEYVQSSPAVVDGTVYVGSADNTLYALDAGTGSRNWEFSTEGEIHGSPSVADDTLFIGSYDGFLYAVSTADGTERWRYETGPIRFSSPAVVDDTVYVGGGNVALHAVSASGGSPRWDVSTDDSILSSPAVAGGTVFIGSDDGNVYAFGGTE